MAEVGVEATYPVMLGAQGAVCVETVVMSIRIHFYL